MLIRINTLTTTLEQYPVQLQGNRHCKDALLSINRVKASSWYIINSTACRAEMTCTDTGKKIPRKDWPAQVRKLADERVKLNKPSYWQRFGSLTVVAILIIAVLVFAVSSRMKESARGRSDAATNYAKDYDAASRKTKIQALRPGDKVLATHESTSGSSIGGLDAYFFQIVTITDSTIVFRAFLQPQEAVTREQYSDPGKLDEAEGKAGEPMSFIADKKTFYAVQRIVEAGTFGAGYNVVQIKKQ